MSRVFFSSIFLKGYTHYTMSQMNNIKFHIFKVVGSFGKVPEPDGSDPNRPENLKFGILGTKNRTMVLIYDLVPVRFLDSFGHPIKYT
jgi:hypothetical protein